MKGITKCCKSKLTFAFAFAFLVLVGCGRSTPYNFETEATQNKADHLRPKRSTGLANFVISMLLEHSNGVEEDWADIFRPNRYGYLANPWRKLITSSATSDYCHKELDYSDQSYGYSPTYAGNLGIREYQYPSSNGEGIFFRHQKGTTKKIPKVNSYSYIPSHGYDIDWTSLLPTRGELDYGDLPSVDSNSENTPLLSAVEKQDSLENEIQDQNPPPNRIPDTLHCSCKDLVKLNVGDKNIPNISRSVDDDYVVLFVKKDKLLDLTKNDGPISATIPTIADKPTMTEAPALPSATVALTSKPLIGTITTTDMPLTLVPPKTTLDEGNITKLETSPTPIIVEETTRPSTVEIIISKTTGHTQMATVAPIGKNAPNVRTSSEKTKEDAVSSTKSIIDLSPTVATTPSIEMNKNEDKANADATDSTTCAPTTPTMPLALIVDTMTSTESSSTSITVPKTSPDNTPRESTMLNTMPSSKSQTISDTTPPGTSSTTSFDTTVGMLLSNRPSGITYSTAIVEPGSSAEVVTTVSPSTIPK